jgi:hypothetical protein
MYKAFLIDKGLIAQDPHFVEGCNPCHRGNEEGKTKEAAHKGKLQKPSDDLTICGKCHDDITRTYKTSLHYTSAGQGHGVAARFSKDEKAHFEKKVFDQSCRSCHASCGDCHVKAPAIGGISIGLIKGHKFVKRDEGKTCAFCHGGRVYPEFTGEYGGSADVHYQKGMICLDCHKKAQLHGDGVQYASRRDSKEKQACTKCHEMGKMASTKAKESHGIHETKVTCVACHSGGPYRNCYDCHLGAGATPKPGFILGLNPRDKKMVTTLRVIPTVRDTFKSTGIAMTNFDALPNYWDTAPHNIRKRTERTRSCETCHADKKDFLSRDALLKNGSKANESLIYSPKPITSSGGGQK